MGGWGGGANRGYFEIYLVSRVSVAFMPFYICIRGMFYIPMTVIIVFRI